MEITLNSFLKIYFGTFIIWFFYKKKRKETLKIYLKNWYRHSCIILADTP